MKPEYWWVISDCKCFPHSLFFISKNNIHAPEQIISRHAALYWTKHRSSTKEWLIIIVLSPDAETFHHLLTATSLSLLLLVSGSCLWMKWKWFQNDGNPILKRRQIRNSSNTITSKLISLALNRPFLSIRVVICALANPTKNDKGWSSCCFQLCRRWRWLLLNFLFVSIIFPNSEAARLSWAKHKYTTLCVRSDHKSSRNILFC